MKIDRGSTAGQVNAGAPGAASKLDRAKPGSTSGRSGYDAPGGDRSPFKALLERPGPGCDAAPTPARDAAVAHDTDAPHDTAAARATDGDLTTLEPDAQPPADELAASTLPTSPSDAEPAACGGAGAAGHDVDARPDAHPASGDDAATPRSDDAPDYDPRHDANAALLAGQPPLQAPAVAGAPVEAAAPAPPPAAVAQVFEKIVQSYQVGSDVRARKVVMLDVDVPGRGGVRVRVSRNGDAVEVRMRADNPELAGLLRAHRDGLYCAGEERGFRFARIEVVG